MKTDKPTYQLARDDFGQWYIIPTTYASAFGKWLDTAAARKQKFPEWAQPVASYSKVKFRAFTIE